MIPCALIINTLTNVLTELFLKSVCIFLNYFLYFVQLMLRNPVILSQLYVRL